jgi:hypothetical protein
MVRLLPQASLADTLALFAKVLAPTIAQGPIIRRPRLVALAERLGLDRRAIRAMQELAGRYGPGPLMLSVPGSPRAVILSPAHVARVLDQSPDPFATDSSEKHAALEHFEPRGSLISRGAERADRRQFNEAVLRSDRAIHPLAERFVAVVDDERSRLLLAPRRRGVMGWEEFSDTWFRMVRRIVLGEGAAEDRDLTDAIARLRKDANWAMLRPVRRGLRARMLTRLAGYLQRAEPGSLAAVVARTPVTGATEPPHQVPQWLFAFDAAAMATFRALALLATHEEYATRVREEIREGDPAHRPLPLLRATLLESVRLWPTTPMVLRQTTGETTWEAGTMPAGTGILIFAPFFHRDDRRQPFADRFAPELWPHESAGEDWPLFPFSRGPAFCPGRSLVLLLGSAMLAGLLRGTRFRLPRPARLDPSRPLPATLNHFGLKFEVAPLYS